LQHILVYTSAPATPASPPDHAAAVAAAQAQSTRYLYAK
jgi:hypothetical protein